MTELSLATPKSAAEPGRLRRLFRWLAGDLRAALAILVLLVLVIVAIGAPWIAPYAPTAQDANNMLAAPGPGHLLGTDDLGRDIFSRLVYGAPATIYASLLAVGVAILIGLPVGLAPASSAAGPTTSSAASSTLFCRSRPSCWRSRSPARSALASPTA